ncbi:MAG: hypothetical protein PHF86_10600 [Candidatus Nanoarchaeia archaeon]|jgi:hypothetical protein|nr:hypothetical protein [Candidatus Nanoarchaeia archaeon]
MTYKNKKKDKKTKIAVTGLIMGICLGKIILKQFLCNRKKCQFMGKNNCCIHSKINKIIQGHLIKKCSFYINVNEADDYEKNNC